MLFGYNFLQWYYWLHVWTVNINLHVPKAVLCDLPSLGAPRCLDRRIIQCHSSGFSVTSTVASTTKSRSTAALTSFSNGKKTLRTRNSICKEWTLEVYHCLEFVQSTSCRFHQDQFGGFYMKWSSFSARIFQGKPRPSIRTDADCWWNAVCRHLWIRWSAVSLLDWACCIIILRACHQYLFFLHNTSFYAKGILVWPEKENNTSRKPSITTHGF